MAFQKKMPNGLENEAAAGATTGIMAPKRIYVISGDYGRRLNQVYDPERDTWTTGTSMQTSRSGLAVAVVNDKLYAIGGTDGYNDSAVNEEYTPIGYGTIPTVSVVSPENKMYDVNNVSLTFTVSKPTSWIGYSLDGQQNVTIKGNTTIAELSNGLHNVTVYANDTLGNTGMSETIYFTIAFERDPRQPSEPFPTTLVIASIASVAVIGIGLLIYFKKRRH